MTRFPDSEQAVEDVSDARIAALDALFGRELLARTASDLWQQPAVAVSYSPAARFYLQRHVAIKGVLDFDTYFRIWVRAFYDTRHDVDSAGVVLMLFLHHNLAVLKDLFILDRPANAAVAPEEEAVRTCLQTQADAALAEGEQFAHWVLRQWLPSHLQASGIAPLPEETAPAEEAGAYYIAG